MAKLPVPDGEDGVLLELRGEQSEVGMGTGTEPARPAWGSKLQYVLAQVGFSVGLGNVWRFPYLCHQNGGGAFLLLYVLLLALVGVPLFFLELAAGQRFRQGSIGVWKHLSPRLAGIGYSSCVVCFYVALYYNVIIAWSLFYLGNSFQYPLPWMQCPSHNNQTVEECARSSPTTFFWFRKTLDITDSINQTKEFNPIMTGCLLAAWTIVCLGMIKGIQSSAKVMYFSSLFPYAVLFCFLVRGLLMDGASDGIIYMFYPKLQIWGEVQVWRQAATQVFFALGLGFGSVIAYSSYNPPNNNCHRDALMVSCINLLTSILASLVVFAVLGFRAKNIAMECVARNVKHLVEMSSLDPLQQYKLPWASGSDPRSVTLWEYREWFQQYGSQAEGNITDCSLEEEMNKGVEGTGLAFITFTEAMALFPASPLWSALFFFMLFNLGLSTMFGTMQGILTPLMDNFRLLGRHKTLLTVGICVLGFTIGLLFTQRSGNYFVTVFDDYSATLPLIIVVVFETLSVSWVYGADRFLNDVAVMLKWRPPVLYKYLWQFVCLLAMVGLLAASVVNMVFKRPTYTAWNQSMASETVLEYPSWTLALLCLLILISCLPLPMVYIHALLQNHLGHRGDSLGQGLGYRETYTKCDTDEHGSAHPLTQLEEEEDAPDPSFLSQGVECYRLLPQKEDVEEKEEEEEEDEKDTGL